MSLHRRERKHGKAEHGEGKGGASLSAPSCLLLLTTAPAREAPLLAAHFFGCRRALTLPQRSCGLSPSFLSYKTCGSHHVLLGWRSMARRASPPVPTLPGGAWWLKGNGLVKVSAALAALRTGPGQRVLRSGRGGEECGQRGLELCRSLCWTRPRDLSPVPAALPHGQQSKRLPKPLAGAAAGPGEASPSQPPAV